MQFVTSFFLRSRPKICSLCVKTFKTFTNVRENVFVIKIISGRGGGGGSFRTL